MSNPATLVANPNLKNNPISSPKKSSSISFFTYFLNEIKKLFSQINSSSKLIIIPVIIFVLYFLTRYFFGQSTITVIGTGEYEFQPDQLSYIVTYANVGEDAPQAINNGKNGIDNLINLIKSISPDVVIQKAFYEIQPTTNVAGAKVYQVVNAFSVKSNSVDKVDFMLQALYENGATSVNNLSFGSSREKEMSLKARTAAIKNARNEAKIISRSAGKFLGKIVTISDDQKQASSNVGTLGKDTTFTKMTLTKNVSVIYRIW